MKDISSVWSRKMSWRIITLVLFVLVAFQPGCSRVTQENYAKLKVGMEYEEVVAILGKPASCNSVLSATNCLWGGTKRSIEVSFVADKVVFLSGKGI